MLTFLDISIGKYSFWSFLMWTLVEMCTTTMKLSRPFVDSWNHSLTKFYQLLVIITCEKAVQTKDSLEITIYQTIHFNEIHNSNILNTSITTHTDRHWRNFRHCLDFNNSFYTEKRNIKYRYYIRIISNDIFCVLSISYAYEVYFKGLRLIYQIHWPIVISL